MRIVLMGTGAFAGPSFEALIQSPGYDVIALFTRPSPTYRPGRKPPPPSPMRELATTHGLSVFDPTSINDEQAVEQLRGLAPEVLVVCDYGQILKPPALSAAPLGGINLHGSLLPKFRGAAPVHWAIWEGETTTGVTVIHMTPKLDGGPRLARASTAIGAEETAEELEPRLAELGVQPVRESLEMLRLWDGESPLGERQDPGQVTQAPRLSKHHGRIDWTQTAARLHLQFRALQPWPGVYTTAPAKKPLRLIIRQLAVVDAVGEPGSIVRNDGQSLWVATGDGALDLQRVQPAGKREMDMAEFLRGRELPIGTCLGETES